MGIFGTVSPFDPEIEKATSENNTSEEWGLIMEICDKVGASSANAKDCLKSILRRLSNPDPHVVVQAITLLDACVNNCGKVFHLEIASREFETEYRKLLAKAQPPVTQKLKGLLKRWSEGEFKSDPQLNLIPSLLSKLKSEGIDFSDVSDMPLKKKDTSRATSSAPAIQKEEEDLARAIELSLQETKQGSPRNSSGPASSKSLYPTFNQMSAPATAAAAPEAKKVRALYDFEAAEDNELTFMTGEIIHVIDSSDPNWWKGYNQRGEGLFPANFVTADLSVEPQPKADTRKVQFSEAVAVTQVYERDDDSVVEIDEGKIDRLLSLLHEANPEDGSNDSQEMLHLENEVYRMGPLIDQALEKADKQHAQLTQLSADLVDALNLYHSLMREPPPPAGIMKPPFPQTSQFAPPPQMYNGTTSFASVPSMNPYFSHIQQPAPGSMGTVSSAAPVNMMGIPQQSMGMMMMPSQQMGPSSMVAMGPGPLGQPSVGPGAMGQPPVGPGQAPGPMQQQVTPQHGPTQATSQHYAHQQSSFLPTSGGIQQPLPPTGPSQGYVM